MKAAELAIPLLICALIIFALMKKVNIYKAFTRGAKEALPRLFSMLPYLAAMLCAIEVFRSSGALGLLTRALSPAAEGIGLPPELLPVILLRPFSGSAALALLKDTLTEHGADGYVGRAASVIVGSTETVFYTVALYFGAVNVTRTRHAIPAALIAGAVGAAAGLLLAKIS
ncbi:MAG: spore maturation protein [Clostridia bacterium]|nr:spore maturation protein [Clostridia bacterium]